MKFEKIKKIKKGDKIAIVSPSFAAPGKWPYVYELALKRVKEVFHLEPVEFQFTKKIGASGEERGEDLINAFENRDIKAVMASIGGNDQVTYIKNLPTKPFKKNPKMFFGYSDNSHFCNFLWLNGIPSYYGAHLFTQLGMQRKMDDFTIEYINHALFEEGVFELKSSPTFNDVGLNWDDPKNLNGERVHEKNDGWFWDGDSDAEGITWGGCLESIDEMLRNDIEIPTLRQFEGIILFTETSEEMPSEETVFRVYRALGERGILQRVKGIMVGRPKAWHFNNQQSSGKRIEHRKRQREVILKAIRTYNKSIPVIQNMDFGHTDPQICIPYGKKAVIKSSEKRIFVDF